MEVLDHLEDGSVDAVWAWFKRTGDQEARERLVLHYLPLVDHLARRVWLGLPPSVDRGDLQSDGILGLLDAIDRFDPDRGLRFPTYATTRIRGAIVDGLRSSDWVPRSVRGRMREADAAVTRLERTLGRTPRDAEVAAELGVPVADLRAVRSRSAHAHVLSFDAALDDLHVPPAPTDPAHLDDDLPEGFLAAVRELPERHQVVVALYYWDRLTLAEIGQVLGVTESRVSQLHRRAMMTLRRRLLSDAG